jgi:hypothetical protein
MDKRLPRGEGAAAAEEESKRSNEKPEVDSHWLTKFGVGE